MESTVVINEVSLPIKEWNGQRLVTLKDIDNVHGRVDGMARKSFNRNKERFIQGVDFFVHSVDEAKRLFNAIAPNGLVTLTESGYLMIVKSFTDDKSWEVQRDLVNSYFKLKEVSHALSEELPVDTQALYQVVMDMNNNFRIMCEQMNSMENAFDNQFMEFKQALERISFLLPDNKVKETNTKISTTKITTLDPIRDTIKPLAELYNDKSTGYNGTYRKVYAAMEVDWKYRQSRYRNSKGNKNKPSKFYLLESDTKLLSMFKSTVTKLFIEATEANK